MKITDIDFSKDGQKYIVSIRNEKLEVVTYFGELRTEFGEEITEYYTLQGIINEAEFELCMPEVEVKVGIKVGDILKTTNGDFLIIQIGVDFDNLSHFPRYGAIYIDYKYEHPYELQYVSDDLKDLFKDISDDGDVIEVVGSKVVNKK